MIGQRSSAGLCGAARRPIHGRDPVARFMVGIARPERGAAGITLHRVDVNGRPGRLMVDADGRPVGVLSLDVADGLVQTVRIVINPDKLTHLRAP